VADVGCGPGHVTAHLHDSGLDAFGIALSPLMIDRCSSARAPRTAVRGGLHDRPASRRCRWTRTTASRSDPFRTPPVCARRVLPA